MEVTEIVFAKEIVLLVFLSAMVLGVAIFGIVALKFNGKMMKPYSDEQIEQLKRDNEIFSRLVKRIEPEE